MSVVILPELAVSPARKRWTREEAERMVDAGLIEGRYELLEGEIISKMGQKPAHSYVILALNDLLSRNFIGRRIRIQLPIRLPDPIGKYSEPEPDVVLLYRDSGDFLSRHPGPDEIALLIEVSDTTVDIDRGVKRQLYAAAGISEYWIFDLQRRQTIVCRRPAGNEYLSIEIFGSSQLVTASSAKELTLTLDSLLAPLTGE